MVFTAVSSVDEQFRSRHGQAKLHQWNLGNGVLRVSALQHSFVARAFKSEGSVKCGAVNIFGSFSYYSGCDGSA